MFSCHEWAVELEAFGLSYASGWTGGTRWAVRDVNLRLPPGIVLGLFGPNGSGKSSTLKALAGLRVPAAGRCLVDGTTPVVAAAAGRIGYLPESQLIDGPMSVREWLSIFARVSGCQPADVASCLASVGLADAAHRPVRTLSKGMRQRLGLAQAIVHRPKLVLLDEPANGLDAAGRHLLGEILRGLAGRGMTVVFTSHLLAHAEGCCDWIGLLGEGRLLVSGRTEDLLGIRRSGVAALSPLEQLYERCARR